MKKYIGLLLVISLSASCQTDRVSGSGEVITQTRQVAGYSGIAVGGSTNAYIKQGSGLETKVKAYASLLPYLETTVDNDVLVIGYKSGTSITNDNSQAFVSIPQLTSLSTSGSGDISASGSFAMDDFTASVSGSGSIILPTGTANHLTLRISGSGDITGFGLVADSAKVTISGSGKTELYVTRQLDLTISGSGDVYLKGDPAKISSHISGSGRLIRQ